MNKTNIEYLSHTWNPIAMRCTPISEGCANCWHIAMANRLAKNPKVFPQRRDSYGAGRPIWIDDQRCDPFRRKKPAVIGVQFMGDIGHPDIPFNMVHVLWDAMKAAPQHIFLILTKRPEILKKRIDMIYKLERMGASMGFWSHVWLGVTVENQARADERIPVLLQIPAAKRFVSIEPMLGEIDLRHIHYEKMVEIDALSGDHGVYRPLQGRSPNKLDWVILGGETGRAARPMHPDWVRSVRDQCQAARVPFFFKQWGDWLPAEKTPDSGTAYRRADNGEILCGLSVRQNFGTHPDPYSGPITTAKIGKKAAGHLLDGREWREMPCLY